MFVVLRTSLIWNDQYRPKGERQALGPASDDRSRPRRTLRHTKHDKLYRRHGFQQRPHTLTLLYIRSNVGP